MRVDRFGIHWAPGNIPFLEQSSGSQNPVSQKLESPFQVVVQPRTLICPHEIDLSQDEEVEWISDPLAQAMLPLPGFKQFVILDTDGRYARQIQVLQRLSTNSQPLLRPIWWRPPQTVTHVHSVTNISPVIFFDLTINDHRSIKFHMDLCRQHERTAIFCMAEDIPIAGVPRIHSDLGDVSGEHLEAIGATALRKYLKSEMETRHGSDGRTVGGTA